MHENGIINSLPEILQEDEISSTDDLSSTIRNEFSKYKDIRYPYNNINTENTTTYRAGISSCSCATSKYLNSWAYCNWIFTNNQKWKPSQDFK